MDTEIGILDLELQNVNSESWAYQAVDCVGVENVGKACIEAGVERFTLNFLIMKKTQSHLQFDMPQPST